MINTYLLPEKFNKKPTNILSFGPKKVIIGQETDLTGGKNKYSEQSLLNEYSDTLEYMILRGRPTSGSLVDGDTFKIDGNVEVPPVPPSLSSSFTKDQKFNVYINGLKIPHTKWDTEVSGMIYYLTLQVVH